MKLFFTLVLLLSTITNSIKAQVDSCLFRTSRSVNPPGPAKASDGKIRFICRATSDPAETGPLLVIDGILYQFSQLRVINPCDIESITILKDAAASAIYGCRAEKGVVLITTKSFSTRKFIIKDFLTGEKIPAATICFTSDSDSVKAVADDGGILLTDKLKPGVQYKMTVSSAGYKTLLVTAIGKEQEVLLEKDIKTCDEIVMIAYPAIRCGRNYINTFTKVSECDLKTDTIENYKAMRSPVKLLTALLYPNPVQRNSAVHLEFDYDRDETMQLSVFSLNGSLVSLQSEKVVKGHNYLSVVIDAEWAAGIYNIQLRNEKRTLARQEKLVVQ